MSSVVDTTNAPWVILHTKYNATTEIYQFQMPKQRQILSRDEYTVEKLSTKDT